MNRQGSIGNDMEKLTGKTALITGGTSGIGLATAKLFAAHGAHVAITGRDPVGLAQAEKEIGEVLAIRSDAGSMGDIDRLMAQVKAAFGKLDVLFVNAGIAQAAPADFITEAQFDEMVSVNFKGAFFTIQKA